MFSIFLGLFIYQLGFGLEGVLLWSSLWALTNLVSSHLIRHLVIKWGSITVLAIGTGLQIVNSLYIVFILTNVSSTSSLYLLILGVIEGLGFSCYAVSYKLLLLSANQVC